MLRLDALRTWPSPTYFPSVFYSTQPNPRVDSSLNIRIVKCRMLELEGTVETSSFIFLLILWMGTQIQCLGITCREPIWPPHTDSCESASPGMRVHPQVTPHNSSSLYRLCLKQCLLLLIPFTTSLKTRLLQEAFSD